MRSLAGSRVRGSAGSSRVEGTGARPSSAAGLRLLSHNQFQYARRRAKLANGSTTWPLIAIAFLAVTYNGFLAFLNARGFYVGRSMVVVTELFVLASAGVVILGSGGRTVDRVPLFFFALFCVNALAVSLFAGAAFIEMARNAAIIAAFTMLGSRLSQAALAKCFLLAAAVVMLVLLIEIFSVESYAELFNPAAYFAQTRGIAPSEFDELGLFGNALGWDERFSILKIIDHRASSIFLEQVSLGNFAVVLTVYLCCCWPQVSNWQKIALISLVVLVVITTASRSALGLVLLAPMAYWLAPRLSRFSSLAVMPLVFASALAITHFRPSTGEDNLEGRLGYTMRNLADLDLRSIAGLNALDAPTFADSGYMYVIVGSTLLGLLILALFVCFVALGRSDASKRCNLLLSLYVFGNLMVSGTSIFSIKTAALLWLLIGFLRMREAEAEKAEVDRRPAVVPKMAVQAPQTLMPLVRRPAGFDATR